MAFCPNVNSKEFKDLVSKVGEDEAYYLWDKYEGNIPASETSSSVAEVTVSKPKLEGLDNVLKDVLSEIGVNVNKVFRLTDSQGKPIDAVAKADMLKKVIEVVEGRADATTLPEEAAHFFVEMLDPESHVFKAMYDKIESYPIFAEVVKKYSAAYGNDLEALKKEAMGKLIAQEIIKLYEQQNNLNTEAQSDRAAKWWNLLLAYIKRQFSKFNVNKLNAAIEEYSPFKETAEAILNKDLNMFGAPITSTKTFFQIENSKTEDVPNTELQKKIVDDIRNNAKGIQIKGENEERGYYQNGVKLGKSVTTRRDEIFDKKFVNRPLDKEGLEKRNFTGKIGTAVHNDIDNIVKRVLSKDPGVVKTIHSDPATYAKLESYITKFGTTFEKGTVFLAEQIVYDASKNMPGTVDLITISPSGEVGIFDWKTMGLNKLEKEEYGEPASYKTEKYDYQITQYKKILQGYGVKKFGKLRYVPINTTYSKDKNTGAWKFKGIEVGDPTLKGESAITKPYLNPVPVAGEQTGIEPVDKLIEELKALHAQVKKKGGALSDIEKKKKAQRSKALRQAILQLQLRKSFVGFIANAFVEFTTIDAMIKNREKSPLTESQLMDMKEGLKIYTDISKKIAVLSLSDKINEEQAKRLKDIQGEAEKRVAMVDQLLKEEFIKAAKEAGITDHTLKVMQEQGYKPVGLASRIFTSLSRIDHPLFRTLWNLVNKANIATRAATEKLGEDVEAKVKNYREWAAAKGYTGASMYEPLIDRKTGKMVSKYSPQFYEERKKRVAAGDWQWVKENTNLDEEGLKKYLEEQRAFIKGHVYSSDAAYNKKIREVKLKELEEKFNVFDNNKAWLNTDSFFVRYLKPKDSWFSKEYKYLQANKPAMEFYNFFTGKMREFAEYLPLSKGDDFVNPDRFIPNVQKDLIERVLANGGTNSVRGLGSNFIDMFEYKASEDPTFGQVNEITGEKEMSIPVYYTGKVDPKDKSYDLGRLLMLFGKMAYNYKNMNEIEGTVRNLRSTLADSKEALTDGSGKVFQNALTGKVINKVVSADTMTHFNDFINYYVYGIKQKDDWGYFTKTKKVKNEETGEIEEVEAKISRNKVAGAVLRTFSAKAIGLNLVSIVANAFGGINNTVIMAAGRQFFTKRQWAKSMAMITAGNFNPQTRLLLQYLNMEGEKHLHKIADKVSANNVLRNPGYDDIFFLQSKTDKLIHNVSAVSMLQNFGIDENGKMKRLDKLPEGTKSIMDQLKVKEDGTLNIADIMSDEEFAKFRAKSQAIGEKMIGMSSRDNVSGFRMTMMGQGLMQFRGWIPRTVGSRFGETRYDPELEVVEKGRMISLFNQLTGGKKMASMLDLLKGVTIGEFGETTKEKVKLLYAQYLADNPTVDPNEVTEEMFYDMHVANVKSAMMEIALIAAFTLLVMALKAKWDDDDEMDKRARLNLGRMLNRTMDELTFYYSPDSVTAITKGAVPVWSMFTDISNFFSDLTGETVGTITGDEERLKKNKPGWRFARLFPGGTTMWTWFGDKQDR